MLKSIPILFHLTIHKIAFHVKFPASLSVDISYGNIHIKYR